MIEEFIVSMPVWQKVLAYAFLLIGMFIFVKTGKLRIFNYPVIPLGWRIALALFFPVIFILGIFFGALILGFGIAAFIILGLFSIFTGKKIKRPKLPRIRVNIIRKNNED